MQFLSKIDYPSLGNWPSTWRDCVLALKDEMATHVVITAAATLLSLTVNIIDWNGVSNRHIYYSSQCLRRIIILILVCMLYVFAILDAVTPFFVKS